MKRVVVLAAGAVLGLSVSAAEAPLLANGDLEQGAVGWQMPRSGQWRVEKGAGLDGSSGLVFEVPKGEKKITWAQTATDARFPVEGGMGYRFSCWMKTDGLTITHGRSLGLYFASYNAEGKPVGGGGAVRVTDNAVRKDGWYRVEGVTKPLPVSAVVGGLYFYSGDCEGVAFLDRMTVEPLALNPVERLTVSAYRAEAWEGDVSFAAAYCVNPVKNPDSELVATLSYVTPTGKGTKACQLADGVVRTTLPVTDFAFGKNEVTLVLGRKDGTELGRSSCFFRREAVPMFRKVTFDSRHRTIVDGKPFFPLGMYWKDVTAEALSVYTNGPFNCLMSYNRMDESRLDLCQRFGVKAIASLSGHFREIAEAKAQKAAEIDAWHVRGRLRRFRSHPAVLAWYLADEVPSFYEEVLAAKREMVYELDPDHPTWIVLDKPQEARTLIRGYDVIGADPYPIGNHGTPEQTAIGIAAGWARAVRKATYDFRPMWQVPQAFDWAIYRPEETNRVAMMRMPTRQELRSMTWQAIAAGANGLVYYAFFDLLERDGWRKDRVAGGWEDLCAVAREVKAFEPVLLSDDPPPVVEGGDGDVAARAWSCDGKHCIVMANTLRKKVAGALKVGGREVPYELDPIEVKFVNLGKE